MNRLLLVSIVLMAFGTSLVNAQRFQLRGLEIYNPYFYNPAYVQAEKTVQLDFLGYNFYYLTGIWTSAMASIPKFNSSAGARFASSSFDESAESWILQLAYAYKHSFSEDLHLNGGLMFSSGHVDYADGLFVTNQEELSKRHSGTLGLGVSVAYKKTTAISDGLFIKHPHGDLNPGLQNENLMS